jgi:septal ring factor EnvC (AmiA/AmiB activator)
LKNRLTALKFPNLKAGHKSLVASLSLLTLLWSPSALAERVTEGPKKSLSEVQQRLETLKKQLNSSQEAHKDAADALKDSEVAISLANKQLYEINQRQQENKDTLTQLASDSFSASQTLNQQQQLLSSQLYQQYIHGKQSYLQMILQSEHPSEIARNVYYYSYIAKARAELINKMQGSLDRINQLNVATVAAQQQVLILKQKQVETRQSLESQKREKSKVVSSLSQKIAAQRGEIKKLSRDEKQLSKLVKRLASTRPAISRKSSTPESPEQSDIKEPTQQKRSTKTVIANNTLPSNEFSGGNFSALKGKLRLPIRGEVSNRFGASREDSGISWKGLFIRANAGTEVKAIANGQVVFADWLRGFGNLMILDHGDGYMSLYGNNQALLKSVGNNVRTGDTIAAVGNSGGNESNGLYYELRRQSLPFDPLSWSSLN